MNNRRGFSLIELMIVVAIIALLASIALPRYFAYFAKARQAEVAVILSSLHTAQQAHWIEHGSYSKELSGKKGIGWQPSGYNGGGESSTFYYTYGFYFPGAQEGIHYFTGKLKATAQSLGQCYAQRERFIARAAGDITGKNKLDVWSIDEERRLTHEQNGV